MPPTGVIARFCQLLPGLFLGLKPGRRLITALTFGNFLIERIPCRNGWLLFAPSSNSSVYFSLF